MGLIGEQIGGYAIQSELGSGGMGKVYLAQNKQRVALKILHPHLLESPEALERFRREAEIGQRVEHDNVVRTLDVGSAVLGGVTHHYLVMEYVEGQTLRELLKELGRVPEELCRHIGREITNGLEAIHAGGVVHRDLKPENVLITEDHVVKVMDLGVARLQDAAFKLSQTGAFLGSVLYAAPEQFRGEAPDARADFYSLGLVLYELATGRHPFQADAFADVLHRQLQEEPRPAAELNPQLSPFFEEVCKALLEKDRGKRMGFLPADEESTWWGQRARAIRLETKRPLRRIRVPRETALYGRDDDLARLAALYERAKAGEGCVLLLEGEAGIGKTRLVDEFVGRLEQEGEDLNFLFGSYSPGGAATAAGAFTTAYGEHFGAEGLEETLKGYLTTTPVLVPAFAALLRGEPTPKGEEALTKDSLQTVFVHATRGLAAERPTIVLLDDLHFAPEEGRALFTALALATPGHRLLLVGTMRPGVQEAWIASTTRLGQCEQLSLARLGPKDLIRLLQDSFQSERLAEDLGVRIALKSDGNPFFAFEIIDGLREGQFITKNPDGSWATTRVIDEIQIPSSVLDLIQARIADLDEQERDLLDVASCCGFEFDPGLVGTALGVGQIPALKCFGQIERRHRLVRSAGRHYVFDHHQVQEALYAGLHDQLREPYHTALAEALEARTADPDGVTAVALAEHYLRGGSGERATCHMDRALDHLEESYQNEAAIRLADMALEADGVLDGEARANVLLRKAMRHWLRGEHASERESLDEALRIANDIGALALRARSLLRLGKLPRWQSDTAAAEESVRGALTLARVTGDRVLEARAYGDLGTVFGGLGRLEEAGTQFDCAAALAREIGDQRIEALARSNLAAVRARRGEHEEAIAEFESTLTFVREIGSREAEGHVSENLGTLYWKIGRLGAACAHYQRALALAQEMGFRLGQMTSGYGLGTVLRLLGRTADARAHYERTLAMAREIGNPREAGSLLGLATLCEFEGNLDEALSLTHKALALDREQGHKNDLACTLTQLGAIEAALGDADNASAHLEEALALAHDTGSSVLILEAAVELARVPGGDSRDALEALAEHGDAAPEGARMQCLFHLWELARHHAHLEEAHRLLERFRDGAPEDCRDSMIENVPIHRDIMQAWEEHGQKA